MLILIIPFSPQCLSCVGEYEAEDAEERQKKKTLNYSAMEVLKMILDFLINALKIISPFIGVFVGAFLGYFLNNRFDKVKRKRSVKIELIQDINIFFGLHKDHFVNHNYLYLLVEHSKNIRLQTVPNYQLLDMPKYLIDVEKERDERQQKVNSNYYKLNEVEARIVTRVYEIGDLHGKKVFESVFSLVNPLIEESNDFVKQYLKDYKTLSPAQILDQLQTINVDLQKALDIKTKKLFELNKELYSIIR